MQQQDVTTQLVTNFQDLRVYFQHLGINMETVCIILLTAEPIHQVINSMPINTNTTKNRFTLFFIMSTYLQHPNPGLNGSDAKSCTKYKNYPRTRNGMNMKFRAYALYRVIIPFILLLTLTF